MNNNFEKKSNSNLLRGDATEKQHYVFQAYLRRFSSDSKNKMIWAYINNCIIKEVPIKSVAYSNKMYETKYLNADEISFFKLAVYILNRENIELHNLSNQYIAKYNELSNLYDSVNSFCNDILNNSDECTHKILEEKNDEIKNYNKANLININEKFHSNIESELNGLITEVINLNLNEINNNKGRIVRDIWYQYFRTKTIRSSMKGVFSEMLDNERLCISNGIKAINVNIENVLTPYLLFVPMCCSNNFNIKILKNETSINFITSDQPVINLYADYESNIPPSELMLYYPVSDKFALLVGGKTSFEIEHLTEIDRVNVLNYKIIEAHDNFLFSSDEKQLKDLVDYKQHL